MLEREGDMTSEEIAKVLKLSRQAVCTALRKLWNFDEIEKINNGLRPIYRIKKDGR